MGQGRARRKSFRLAFDKPGTWSQKYNLVWDRILGLNVFPASVAQDEIAYYKTKLDRYGLPLDSRTKTTKTDWSIWTATMADNQADFEAIVNPIFDYVNNTKTRDPICDSYEVDNVDSGRFHARPVVGGFFIKLLTDRDIWKKWTSRDKLSLSNWATFPAKPTITDVVPIAQTWSYTITEPSSAWDLPGFDASSWKQGQAGFGTNPPGFKKNTDWTSSDIWLRREVTLPAGATSNSISTFITTMTQKSISTEFLRLRRRDTLENSK